MINSTVNKKTNPFDKAAYIFERKNDSATKCELNDEFNSWKKIVTPKFLPYRLNLYKLNVDEFKRIVNQKDLVTLAKEQDWINQFNEIMDTYEQEELNYSTFEVIFNPFVQFIVKKIGVHLRKSKQYFNIEKVQYQIFEALHEKYFDMVFRSVIIEVNVARKLNELSGETSEERFRDFMKKMDNINVLKDEFFASYPVLARILTEHATNFIVVFTELVDHFVKDYEEIKGKFKIQDALVNEIEMGLGDTHQNGRTVAFIKFGSNQVVVYKPRSLSIDEKYNDIVDFFNEKGLKYPLKKINVINKDSYGWQQFVHIKECINEGEVNRFYYRQGVLAALFYILGSTDFHAENIVSQGEYPIPIDLETLFGKNLEIAELHMAKNNYLSEFNYSVFGSMMLPTPKIQGGHLIDFDVSAIGARKGQLSEKHKQFRIVNYASDELKLSYEKVESADYNNRPVLNGNTVTPSDYLPWLCEGFSDLYQVALEYFHCEETLEKFLAMLETVEVRHVFRPTQVYGDFLRNSLHPNYLSNGLDRCKLFEYLWKIAVQFPKFKELVDSEYTDLLRNDVPYFTFIMNDTAIYDSNKKRIDDFFDLTGIDTLRERITGISKSDMHKQLKYMSWSLSTLLENVWDKRKEKTVNTNPFVVKKPLLMAKDIGNNFLDRVIEEEEETATWLGLNLNEDGKVDIALKNLDLYDGLLGNAIFFAHLAKETGNPKYEKISRKALETVKISLKDQSLNNSIAVYSGESGYVYTLAHLGCLWEDQALINLSVNRLEYLERLLEDNTVYDFVGGLAGMIVACLNIYETTKVERFKDISLAAGIKLRLYLNNELEMGPGFSHGASGYIYSLQRLNAYDTEHLSLNKKIIDELSLYEDTFYSRDNDNWDKANENRFFWCHGKPGILLRSDKKLNDTDIIAYKEEALDFEKIKNHSLCHGLLGNLDILLDAIETANTESVVQDFLEVLQKTSDKGWVAGLDSNVDMDGMMLGMIGIGYTFLRMHNPAIPSILTLNMPKVGDVNAE